MLGSNVAGVVAGCGDGATYVKTGDRVFGLSDLRSPKPDQAGLQEYAILNSNAIGKSPDGFTDEQVATLPINVVTSWIALFTSFGFGFPAPFSDESKIFDYAAQTVVIIGGGSNAGKFAIQLARIAGVGTVIAIAGPANKDILLAMGATHVIDRYAEPQDIAAQVHAITGKEGATHLYDCVSMDFSLATALLPTSGPSKLRTLLPSDTSLNPECDVAMLDCNNASLAPRFWTQLPKWLEEGRLLPTEYRVIEGLEEVEEINGALDGYRDVGRSGGRQVFVRI